MITGKKADKVNASSQRRPGTMDVQIGALIKHYRVKAGLSKWDLAQALNISSQQLTKYENATNRVSVSRLINLCDAIGVSAADLMQEIVDQETSHEVSTR